MVLAKFLSQATVLYFYSTRKIYKNKSIKFTLLLGNLEVAVCSNCLNTLVAFVNPLPTSFVPTNINGIRTIPRRTFPRTDISPTAISPTDISPKGHFPDGHFPERLFPRLCFNVFLFLSFCYSTFQTFYLGRKE